MNHWKKWKLKKKNTVNNFHLLTESQRLPNMLGQRLYNMLGQRLYNMLGQHLYNMLGQRLYNMLGQRLYNMLGQHFLDEQSEDGFASRNQRWPNENCSLKPNVGPTSTCYLGYICMCTLFKKTPAIYRKFTSKSVFKKKKTVIFLENSLRLVIARTCFINIILKI